MLALSADMLIVSCEAFQLLFDPAVYLRDSVEILHDQLEKELQ